MEIRKVWITKNGQKKIVIPKRSEIEEGDYVMIKKIDVGEKNGTMENFNQ